MRIAVFSDVHGNLQALEAVLADIDRQQPDRVYCLGDLVTGGAQRDEVIDLIRERDIPTVMGNCDRQEGFTDEDPSDQYVTNESRAFLRSLVPEIRLQMEGKRLLLVHGTPGSMGEPIPRNMPLQNAEEIACSANADLLVFGHIHEPYRRVVAGVLLISVGSVGQPRGRHPGKSYALLEIGPGGRVRAEIRRVS